MNAPLMTQAEYARHRGVGAPAVSNWKKAGLLVFGEDPDRPNAMKVDVQRSDARINSRIDPMRGRPTNGPASAPATAQAAEGGDLRGGGESVATVRMDLVKQQTIGHTLRNAREAGELVPIIEMQRRGAELGRVSRERMHSLHRGLAERLAVERDARAIIALLSAETDRVFGELADDVAGGLLTTADDADELPPVENDGAAADAV